MSMREDYFDLQWRFARHYADAAHLPLDQVRALFRQVRQEHPHARSVRGISWLYHLAAYRRLFPPQYGHSARAPLTFPCT